MTKWPNYTCLLDCVWLHLIWNLWSEIFLCEINSWNTAKKLMQLIYFIVYRIFNREHVFHRELSIISVQSDYNRKLYLVFIKTLIFCNFDQLKCSFNIRWLSKVSLYHGFRIILDNISIILEIKFRRHDNWMHLDWIYKCIVKNLYTHFLVYN